MSYYFTETEPWKLTRDVLLHSGQYDMFDLMNYLKYECSPMSVLPSFQLCFLNELSQVYGRLIHEILVQLKQLES